MKKRHESMVNWLYRFANWLKDKTWNKLHRTSHKDWLDGYKKWKQNGKAS